MGKNCIIIPSFNEEDNIASVITGIKNFADADIIVIDDGSEDLTANRAREAGAFVIRHPFNLGYGAALQTGYKYAVKMNYDFLLQMDGDGQHDPRSIPESFRLVESCYCDALIGSRFLGNGEYRAGVLKSIGIRVFRLIIRMITGERITDPTSGYQCLNRRVLRYFTSDSFPCDYPDANIIIALHRMGFVIKEIPVAMVTNREGRSMHKGIFTIAYYCFKILLSIFIILIREEPYHLLKESDR